MKKTLCALWLLSLCMAARTQAVTWNGNRPVLAVGEMVSVLEDTNGKLEINQVSSTTYATQFRASGQQILHFGFSQSAHWLRFSLQNKTPQHLVLEIAQAFLPYADLYFKDSAAKWVVYKAGYTVNLNQKKIKEHFQVFPLPQGTHDFYVRLISYTHPLPIRIWNESAYEIKADKQKLFYGVYTGILLFVIAINVFLFFALRKGYYLHYAVLVFLYLATAAAVMEGFVVYVIPQTDLMYWYTLIPALNMPVLLSYCISFLEVRKYSYRLYRIAVGACIYFIAYLIWKHFLPLTTVLLVNQVHALLIFMIVTVLGIAVQKKGNRLGYYFAAAYAIWLVLVAIEAIYIQFGTPAYFFGFSYVSLAIFIEVFLLAYLLSKRFEWERVADQRARFEMEANLRQMQQKFQQEILQAKLEIQETTFNNISQEIHDNVGQILSLAKMQVSMLEYAQTANKGKLQELKENLTKALSDLRDIARSLSGERLHKIGLVASLEQEINRINKSAVLEALLTVNGERARLSEQKQLLIFRIAQEVFQNILKHADAKQVQVMLHFYPEHAELCIEDNGKGFPTTMTATGLGLQNIRSRAALLGGEVRITSALQQGTRVQLLVPYDDKP